MAAPLGNRLQNMLQSAVQSVQWTYSLFWQICPQQGVLVWGDGYYNGAIKTRKTIQPMEVTAEEASLQRSQQLRELYDSLSAGETNQPARRPCAALSPEDLTESEWFYLMCVSFSFPSGSGLPGKAYARRQHVWLTGANESDSKTFSRAILAKSARVQTVVCIPLLDGVVEFGTTERVQEDLGFVQHVKTFFTEHHPPHPPKPALSEHSTSNPATSSAGHRFHSSPMQAMPILYAAEDPPANVNEEEEEEEEEDDDEEEEEEAESDSEAETGRAVPAPTEPSELMQLEMSEDIRLGSPDDASNNLDSDFHMLAVSAGNNNIPAHRADSFRAESARRWPALQQEPSSSGLQPQPQASGGSKMDELSQEETHYSQTVSTILQNQPSRWAESGHVVPYSIQSAFAKWTLRDNHVVMSQEGTSQWLLKYVLFTVPFLHTKKSSSSSRDVSEASARFRKGTPQDELSANHVLAERRRREKLNERFIILRSLVPFVTKMDKASILGDTIEYVKQLRKKIQDLETRNLDQRSRSAEPHRTTTSLNNNNTSSSGLTRVGSEKRKLRIVEGSGGGAKAVTVPAGTTVQVSIIESDALVEMQCPYREGLLLDVMMMLRELRVEITTVHSSITNAVFQAEMRAKVKENDNGKKASIVEVKRAMYQIIPQAFAE